MVGDEGLVVLARVEPTLGDHEADEVAVGVGREGVHLADGYLQDLLR